MIKVNTGTDELLCQIEERVATVTLNKPARKNALGDIITPALRQCLLTLEADDRVGCILLTGAGDAFCAGGDIGGMADKESAASPPSREQRILELTEKQRTLTRRLYHLKKITVAALPGPAAGAGLSIALACDLRVAADTAFITTAFRNVGLSGDYGGSWFLPRLIGLGRAKELYYGSPRVGAEEALAMGLLNRVFPRESFREDAFSYAKSFAQGPSETLARMKLNLNAAGEQGLSASLALEAEHVVDSFAGDEAKEAISAFMEKRSAVFHGKNEE